MDALLHGQANVMHTQSSAMVTLLLQATAGVGTRQLERSQLFSYPVIISLHGGSRRPAVEPSLLSRPPSM